MSERVARGAALLDLRRYAEAVGELGLAVAENPDDLEARCQLARAYLGEGQPKDALREAEAALAAAADFEWAHRLRSYALLDLGKSRAAVDAARRAVEADPGMYASHVSLAQALAASSALKLASETAAIARKLEPDEPYVHVVLGWIAVRRKRFKEAIGHAETALSLNASNAEALNLLGVTHAERGDRQAAARALEAAGQTDPRFSDARENLERLASTSAWSGRLVGFGLAMLVFGVAILLGGDPPSNGWGPASIGIVSLILAILFLLDASKSLTSSAEEVARGISVWERIRLNPYRPWFLALPPPAYLGAALLISYAVIDEHAISRSSNWTVGTSVLVGALAILVPLAAWRTIVWGRQDR